MLQSFMNLPRLESPGKPKEWRKFAAEVIDADYTWNEIKTLNGASTNSLRLRLKFNRKIYMLRNIFRRKPNSNNSGKWQMLKILLRVLEKKFSVALSSAFGILCLKPKLRKASLLEFVTFYSTKWRRLANITKFKYGSIFDIKTVQIICCNKETDSRINTEQSIDINLIRFNLANTS